MEQRHPAQRAEGVELNYYNEHDPKAAAWLRALIAAGLIPPGDVDERSITEIKSHELSAYTQCHFFAGIGGWSLALELAGWPASRPVWTGSCPCQPFSSAGKQLAQADARHLWPVFFALIRECRPECVFGEQVASAIGKGWLDGISSDLEGVGYACGAAVLGAHSVGAPHIRQRLYWVADSNSGGRRADGVAGGLPEVRAGGPDLGMSAAGASSRCRAGGIADTDGGLDGTERARANQRAVSAADGGDTWQRVSFAADCLGSEDGELGDECSVCGLDYSNECQCPGPTQDEEFEYEERDGVLYARRLGVPVCTRLEGHAGHEHDGHEPGRFDAAASGPAATAGSSVPPLASGLPNAGSDVGGGGQHEPVRGPEGRAVDRGIDAWSSFDLIPCADGKARRIEPGLAPLAHGIPARVVRLRGYGNAIVPQVAAEFIQAFCEARA